jgi:NAD(P)H-quinone oxidoreductase subunit 5
MSVGSLNLDQLADWVRVHPQLTPPMHLAAVLVVVAVALKSAQLPFHGWLLQVMEAPTPVSALLHAGVVNIGGLVMIRLAPWLAHAPVAQLLLVVIGLVTTVLAALVMTTRVSVKVALAWSTCAQMGFMLVQCGLGAWHLALLHLVAHSLYKAHAFLSAGSAVDGWRIQAMTQPQARPSFGRLSLGVLVALGGAALGAAALRPWLGSPPQGDLSVPVLAILVSLSMVPMLARRATGGLWSTAAVLARVMAVTGLYLAWHAVAAALVPTVGVAEQPSALGWGLVGGALVALFALKTLLELRPAGRLATALYPWLYAGFYLDERFTRLTFRLWPPRLAPSNSPRTLNLHQTLET